MSECDRDNSSKSFLNISSPPWRFQSIRERLSGNEKTTTLGSLWEGGVISGWKRSRRKERECLEEWFSIFNGVAGNGFIVKQRLRQDLREVWEDEETCGWSRMGEEESSRTGPES